MYARWLLPRQSISLIGWRRNYIPLAAFTALASDSSHAVAWHAHYIMSLCGVASIYLESPGATGADYLAGASPEDALLAVSVLPYTRATVDLAKHAAGLGVTVLAITDSPVAPLARLARDVAIVSTKSPSFFHSMSPAFFAAEVLGALVAGRRGECALHALRKAESHLSVLQVHLRPSETRKPR